MKLEPFVRSLVADMPMAAKGMHRVSLEGRAMLLSRAAVALDQFVGENSSGSGSLPFHLRLLAANIEDHSAGALASALCDAADAILKAVALIDAKPEGSA